MASPTTDRRLGLVGNTATKAPVTVLAAGNITQSGEQTIDGIAVLASNSAGVPDRVICVGMTDAAKNGIFDVSTAGWTRSLDANGNYDFTQGTTVYVARGNTYAGTYWKLDTLAPITIGTTLQSWSRALASALSTVTFLQAGAGAVTRGAQDKMRDLVHAYDYGVVGDGATDDTTALANAITQATTLKKKLLISGTPLISSQITVPDGAYIEFDGAPGNYTGQLPKSYLIKKNTGVSYVAVLVSGQSALLRGGGVVAQAGNAGDNIQITGNCVRWEHAFATLAGNDNCRIGKDASGVPNANKFVLISPCFVNAVRDNLHIEDVIAVGGSPNANAGLVQSPFLTNAGRYNLYGGNSFANTIVGILSESAVDKGVYLNPKAVAWVFVGGDVEQNSSGAGVAGSDLYIEDTEIACTFQDAGDTVTKVAHGLTNTTPIRFSVINTTTGIVVNTTYFVVNAAANTFQVSATSGGAALPLTTDGSGVYHRIASGVTRGHHQFIGTNIGTPPYDGGYQTSRGWTGFADFGAASGVGTINGEGTCTPTFAGTVTAGTNTYSTQVGRWTKNGRLVTVPFDIAVSANTVAMAGNLRVSGMPFVPLANSAGLALSLVNGITLPSSNFSFITGAMNGNNLDLYAGGSGQAFTAIPSSNISSTSARLAGVVSYMTADC